MTLSRLMTAILILTTIGTILAMINAVNAGTATGRWLSLGFLVANLTGFVIAARELRSERSNQDNDQD